MITDYRPTLPLLEVWGFRFLLSNFELTKEHGSVLVSWKYTCLEYICYIEDHNVVE